MKIGLFFGSFNPIHHGHLMVASFIANHTDLKQVWLVVSPQNPHKTQSSLLNEYDRLHLAQLAIEDDTQIKVSDIEFKLPKPSYTIDTLTYLQEKYPQHQFYVIMGSDSFQNLPKWKNFEALIKNYQFIVYKRPGFEIIEDYGADVQYLEAPMLELSATLIRNNCKDGITIRYLVPEGVRLEIERNNYFKEDGAKAPDKKKKS
ncbi:MAG: nicotinate-nucleotide adenylyltransferase [Chitinophagia bacterium]|jgi:nicotinate-nucleotide adenylyltransferase|nr:nicotinate-nucleotide adenylyltransferase [Chitinophagia bacterium]